LNQGIPLPDNSVGVIWASHILEHLFDKHKILSEIHRVLVDGGWAFIQVPSTDGRGAFQDPTHVSYWNENCFWYYVDKNYARFIRNDKINHLDSKHFIGSREKLTSRSLMLGSVQLNQTKEDRTY
jgi:ubiquinone/menaquinone biosynthesis C-methylase UbiE